MLSPSTSPRGSTVDLSSAESNFRLDGKSLVGIGGKSASKQLSVDVSSWLNEFSSYIILGGDDGKDSDGYQAAAQELQRFIHVAYDATALMDQATEEEKAKREYNKEARHSAGVDVRGRGSVVRKWAEVSSKLSGLTIQERERDCQAFCVWFEGEMQDWRRKREEIKARYG